VEETGEPGKTIDLTNFMTNFITYSCIE
jgi:hypothetical protein